MNKLLIITIVAAVAIFLIFLFAYISVFGAPQKNAAPEQFVVALNESMGDVTSQLLGDGFIKNQWAFDFVLNWGKVNSIKPGGYQISKAMNVWELMAALSKPPFLKWAVIPEGLRKEEIADILASALSWNQAKKNEWLSATNSNPDYFEGVYFPDTYLIPVDESPANVAKRLQAKFQEKFAPYASEALKQNIKWDTVLKIASIVQREAAGQSDMPLISGIIWNRLLGGMKLDVDATVQYARGNAGKGWWVPITAADKKINSPYNTYLYQGLPPHPIDNPGLDAINAALNPQKTDCLYYLHDNSGVIHCAATYEEHQKNIAKYIK